MAKCIAGSPTPPAWQEPIELAVTIPASVRSMTQPIYPTAWAGTFPWRNLSTSYIAAPALTPTDHSPAVLIHGFGACKEHWRSNVDALRRERDVFALDLVGFGASDKPSSRLSNESGPANAFQYGIDSWAAQVEDLLDAVVCRPATLIGNSIGGVVALAAAARLEAKGQPARRVVLVDCAQRALDDKRLAEQPPFRRWSRPLLKQVVQQRWVTTPLFQALIKPGIIRRVLQVAYPTGAHVDDPLVQLLLEPALQPGAAESFRGFINLFNDRMAPELLAQLRTPVDLIWGVNDPWEPIAEARRWRSYPCVESLEELPNLGHCPHDESPDLVNPLLLRSLERSDKTL